MNSLLAIKWWERRGANTICTMHNTKCVVKSERCCVYSSRIDANWAKHFSITKSWWRYSLRSELFRTEMVEFDRLQSFKRGLIWVRIILGIRIKSQLQHFKVNGDESDSFGWKMPIDLSSLLIHVIDTAKWKQYIRLSPIPQILINENETHNSSHFLFDGFFWGKKHNQVVKNSSKFNLKLHWNTVQKYESRIICLEKEMGETKTKSMSIVELVWNDESRLHLKECDELFQI